jgi:hypothetical protein
MCGNWIGLLLEHGKQCASVPSVGAKGVDLVGHDPPQILKKM